MSVTPDFIGQVYKDTNTGNIWRANSTTPGDWTLEVQNNQIKWLPRTIKIAETMEFSAYTVAPSIVGITSITLEIATTPGTIDIEDAPDLVTLSLPNLVTLTADAGLLVFNSALLTSISAPNLQSVGSAIALLNNAILSSVDLSSLVNAGSGDFGITDCPSLVSLSLPNYVPTNGNKQNLSGNGLNVASINAFLARCVANAAYVSGIIDLRFGTNAAPTGQGATDKTTLIGRGCTVQTN